MLFASSVSRRARLLGFLFRSTTADKLPSNADRLTKSCSKKKLYLRATLLFCSSWVGTLYSKKSCQSWRVDKFNRRAIAKKGLTCLADKGRFNPAGARLHPPLVRDSIPAGARLHRVPLLDASRFLYYNSIKIKINKPKIFLSFGL